MPQEHIIVLAVDGLRASALGAYGNTSFLTPALDQLAADSLVLDACFADSAELPLIYRALWQSLHPLCPVSGGGAQAALPQLLAKRGYATTLITDDAAIVAHPLANQFDECVQVPALPASRASEISETALAQLFGAVCDQVEAAAGAVSGENPRAQFIWVHSRGMYGPWDAPLALQESLLEQEEGDPAPCDSLEPPDIAGPRALDPDEAFRWNCGYAAQVMVLDECWEGLRECLRETGIWDRCLFVLCGVRGFPVGEHGRIGGVDDRLYAEQLHVPMMMRFADEMDRLARSGQLASHVDLMPKLLGSVASKRDVLIAACTRGPRAIRTADWCLRCDTTSNHDAAEAPTCELYVRPDDRWEANDVVGLCPEVVEDLTQRLAQAAIQFEQSAASRSPA